MLIDHRAVPAPAWPLPQHPKGVNWGYHTHPKSCVVQDIVDTLACGWLVCKLRIQLVLQMFHYKTTLIL